jgi:hypothetical protein
VEVVTFSSNGFSVESEMQLLAREHGLRVAEVPITADYTDQPKRSAVNHGLMVLNGILRLMGQYRPLLFFGMPGLAALLLGISCGVLGAGSLRRAQTLMTGYALTGVLLVVVGCLALFSGIMLHAMRGILLDVLRNTERTWDELNDPIATSQSQTLPARIVRPDGGS